MNCFYAAVWIVNGVLLLTWIQSDFRVRSLRTVPQPDDCLFLFHVWQPSRARSCRPHSTTPHLAKQTLPVAAGSAKEPSGVNSPSCEIQWIGRVGRHAQTRRQTQSRQQAEAERQKYIPRALLGRYRWCNSMSSWRDYCEIRHCPEASWDWRKGDEVMENV